MLINKVVNMADNSIDNKDVLFFLKSSLFGSEYSEKYNTDAGKIDLAIKRAYRDMNRTIDEDDKEKIKIEKCRVVDCLKGLIIEKQINKIIDQPSFDEWHSKLCEAVTDKKFYTFGQAQKWVNMTLKYLLVLDYEPVLRLIQYLHVPIDKVVVGKALEGEHPLFDGNPDEYLPWSKKIKDGPKNNYYKFQDSLRKAIKGLHPIQWEFKAWNGDGISLNGYCDEKEAIRYT